jgi:hypothetical protein
MLRALPVLGGQWLRFFSMAFCPNMFNIHAEMSDSAKKKSKEAEDVWTLGWTAALRGKRPGASQCISSRAIVVYE